MPVMSPERPPSQSMGGTHLIEQSQQHQSSVAAVSAGTTATNMVLSAIPIETGHVVIHHHHPHQQQSSSSTNSSNRATTYTQIARNGVPQNLLTTAATAVSSSSPQIATKTISAMTTTSSPSKYVVIHQNGNGQYRTTDGTTAAYLTTQSNGVGNIVLLATEPMEVTRADQSNIIVNTNGQGTDEELTPLTWLQDKDLLKGLVVRPNGAKPTGATVSPTRQANGTAGAGPISPTSDFMEDSSISEDNVSSLNSSSDQGISISSSEFSPTSSISSSSSVPNSSTAFTTYHQTQLQQQNVQYNQVTVGTSGQGQTQHFMNNNNLTKNRNHLLSPVKSGAGIPQSLSGTTAYTIAAYNGPSGTTTVVEYKAGTNFSPPPTSARQIVTNHGGILSPQRSPTISAESTSVTITSASMGPGSQLSSPNSSSSSTVSLDSNIGNGHSANGASAPSSTVSITTSTPTTTPHQHYHKKYIREQMNGNDHQQQQHPSHHQTQQQQQHHQRNGNNESSECRGGNSNQQHHIGQQSTQQQQHFSNASESEDFHHRTPVKPNDSNIIYSNGHEERLMARESLNFDSPIHNGVSCRPPSAQKTNINSTSSTSPLISAGSAGVGTSTGSGTTPSSAASPKQKHPTNVPYDPMVHTTNKPPYSFSSLIFMAIEDSPEKALPVKEIYAWIVQHFPYFKTAPVGWKNSVRHNLSLNKSFLKVEKAPNMGKGSLWRVEEHQRQNLMQALARSPFHQSSAVDKFSPYKSNPASSSNNGPVPVSTSSRSSLPPDSPPSSVKCTVNPELFPKLYKTMNDMANKGVTNGTSDSTNDREDGSPPYAYNNGMNGNHIGAREYYRSSGGGTVAGGASGENGVVNNYLLDYSIERLARDCGADSIDDVNAATAMLALKHGANIFTEHFQNGSPVITSSPSEDHTYSAGGGGNAGAGGGGSSGTNSTTHSQNGDNNSSGICSDAAYESGDERLQPSNRTISAEELEEQRRHAEGVDALLSFASSAASSPAKRPSSTSVEEEHISSYTENIPHYHLPSNQLQQQQQHQQQNGATTTARYLTTTTTTDDLNETILYHHHNNNNNSHHSNSYQHHHPPQRLSTSSSSSTTTYETSNYYLASSAATKKLKTSRGIRTKLKRKTTLIR